MSTPGHYTTITLAASAMRVARAFCTAWSSSSNRADGWMAVALLLGAVLVWFASLAIAVAAAVVLTAAFVADWLVRRGERRLLDDTLATEIREVKS